MINLSSFIAGHARWAPDRCAVKYQNRQITYGQLNEDIRTVAGLLVERGICEGDVVALLMKNSAAFIQISFAISHIGAVSLPINFRLSRDEVQYITSDAGARLLFVDEELLSTAPPDVSTIVLAAAEQADAKSLAPNVLPREAVARSPQSLYRLMYTSGTTSRPKGVMHSYENFYWKSVDHVIALGLDAHTRLLIAGPLYHVGAFDLPGIAALWVGGMVSIHREFDPEAVLESIETQGLTGAWLAPVMTSMLLAHSPRKSYDCSSLKWVIAGGERTPESRIIEFSHVFSSARYIDAYGLTESCSGDTLMEPGAEITKIGSTGRPLMHVEISVKNEEGQSLGTESEGEICLRGPKVTHGYWNDPEKTRESFHNDWFRTGDVGFLDADGFLFITDRKKDMIISGGENIASLEVERAIHELPQVADAAVIGVPDERWGERPVAIVVLKPGANLDIESFMHHCRTRLAGFKVPKELILRSSLPRNPSGKILKKQLREEYSY